MGKGCTHILCGLGRCLGRGPRRGTNLQACLGMEERVSFPAFGTWEHVTCMTGRARLEKQGKVLGVRDQDHQPPIPESGHTTGMSTASQTPWSWRDRI